MANDLHRPEYVMILLLEALKFTARVAVTAGDLSLSDFKTIWEIAIYRAMKSLGYTHRAMAVKLSCSLRTIRRMSEKSRSLRTTPAPRSHLRRILRALDRNGPQTYLELSAIPPTSTEDFDTTRVALSMLMDRGLVVEIGGRPTRFSLAEAHDGRDSIWELPLSEMESAYVTGLIVLRCLSEREATLADLRRDRRLKDLSKRELSDVVEFLLEKGYVGRRPGQSGRAMVYHVNRPEIRVQPDHLAAQVRVGLLDMFRKLGLFMDSAMRPLGETVFDQRAWVFLARKASLRGFIDDYKAFVTARIRRLEYEAWEAGDAIRCVMIGAVAQLAVEEGAPDAR